MPEQIDHDAIPAPGAAGVAEIAHPNADAVDPVTGMPMHLEGGVYVPGVVRAQNIAINHNAMGNVTVGAGVGGGAAPAAETPGLATPAAPAETPAAPANPELDQLRQGNEQLRQQLAERDAQIEQLTQQNEQQAQQIQELQEQMAALQDQLNNPNNPNNPNTPPPPGENLPLNEARTALETARNNLLEITIRRKGRMGDTFTIRPDRGRADSEAYANAMTDYRNALANLLQVMTLSAEAGTTEEALRQELVTAAYQELEDFANQEVALNNQMLDEDINNGNRLLRVPRRLMRRWAQVSTRNKILIGLGIGGAVAFGSATAGLGLAGLAAGSAIKFSLGLLNRRASLRNVSEHSRDSHIERIHGRRDTALNNLLTGEMTLEEFVNHLVNEDEASLNRDVRSAQTRNKIGNMVLLAAAGGVAYGAAEGLPSFFDLAFHHGHNAAGAGTSGYQHVAGGVHHHVGSGEITTGSGAHTGATGGLIHNLPKGFTPNEFRGINGQDAVRHAMHVFEQNHIKVHGLTPEKIRLINQDLVNQHFHIASGVNADGSQHVLNWPGGRTQNYDASALEGLQKVGGSSARNWEKLMEVAQSRGVTFTKA